MTAAARSHRTAVALVPPADRHPAIQAIRARHDRQLRRWPPHVNLLYPFVPPEALEEAIPALVAAAARVPAFTVTLARFRWFAHRSGPGGRRFTVWLAPEPAEPVIALQAALQAAFPAHDDLRRFPHGFQPHLSVGQAAGDDGLQRLLAEVQPGWEPLVVPVREVVALRRGPDTPFAVVGRAPLAAR